MEDVEDRNHEVDQLWIASVCHWKTNLFYLIRLINSREIRCKLVLKRIEIIVKGLLGRCRSQQGATEHTGAYIHVRRREQSDPCWTNTGSWGYTSWPHRTIYDPSEHSPWEDQGDPNSPSPQHQSPRTWWCWRTYPPARYPSSQGSPRLRWQSHGGAWRIPDGEWGRVKMMWRWIWVQRKWVLRGWPRKWIVGWQSWKSHGGERRNGRERLEIE